MLIDSPQYLNRIGGYKGYVSVEQDYKLLFLNNFKTQKNGN